MNNTGRFLCIQLCRMRCSFLFKAAAVLIACLCVTSDTVSARPYVFSIPASNLAAQSRLKPFFEEPGIEFRKGFKIAYAAVELQKPFPGRKPRKGDIALLKDRSIERISFQQYEKYENFFAANGFELGTLEDGSEHVTTPVDIVPRIFEIIGKFAKGLRGKRFLDFGAGDLRMSIASANLCGMNSVAVDNSHFVSDMAGKVLAKAIAAGLVKKEDIEWRPDSDALAMDWYNIDVAYLFYTMPLDRAKEHDFRNEIHHKVRQLRPGGILAIMTNEVQRSQLFHEIPGLEIIYDECLSPAKCGLWLHLYRLSENADETIGASLGRVGDKAKVIHDENIKYKPSIPDNAIICHVIVDSILPIKQRIILQDLEKDMAGSDYAEKVVRLTAGDPSDIVEELKRLMERKSLEYKDYNVRFDVACPGAEAVEAVISSGLGVKALAFKPCDEASIAVMQVEGIVLALRALDRDTRKGTVDSLRGVYKFLTGRNLPKKLSDITDINEFIKRVVFSMPVTIVDYDNIPKMNDLMKKYVESEA